MKTINECIGYLQKRITNNQNMIEVSYFNSIIEHLKNSDRFEKIKKAYFGNKLSSYDDIKKYFDLFDEYTKSQVETNITEDELQALDIGHKL